MRLSRRTFLKGSALALTPYSVFKASALSISSGKYIEPKRLRSVNGVLNVTLEAKETMLPYGGGKRWALTYNGTFPGPTLVAKPGDTINVIIKNSMKEMTNLHTHGPHLSPSGNSDNPFIMIAPGKSFKYSFKIPKNQEPGIFWYHPHHHEFVASQLSAGLAGAIIIEGPLEKELPADRMLMISDPRIGKDSSIMDASMMDQMHGRIGDVILVNGVVAPVITSKGPERWRIVNASPSLFLNLALSNSTFTVIGTDGGYVPAYKVNTLQITPGQRYEVLINSNKDGRLSLTHDGQSIAFLDAKRSAASAPTIRAIPKLKADKTRKIAIEQVMGGGMGMRFTFNGESFNPNKVNQSVKLNTVEDWVITNTSHMVHPFHIHAWPFQIIDNGYGKSEPGWKDTVAVPSGKSVTIRINFADFGGKSVYHCHILDHEDAGMMGIVEVK